MTLEQALQAANNGDIGAMRALGKFYFEQKQPSDAVEWYFLAAQHGDFLSAQQATALYYVLADTCEKMDDWVNAGTYWAQFRECQPFIIKADESTNEDCIEALKNIKRGFFGQGLACCKLNQFSLAIEYLKMAAEDNEFVPGNDMAKSLLRTLQGQA